jgi:hypothetical protein
MGREFRKQVLVCTTDGEGRCAEKGAVDVLRKFREEAKARGLADVIVTKLGCTPRRHLVPDGEAGRRAGDHGAAHRRWEAGRTADQSGDEV